jgi:hypothetical protein
MLRCFPILISLALVTGCADRTTSPVQRQSSVPIDQVAPADVFAVAEVVLAQEFPRYSVDRRSQTITTEPVLFSTQRESGSARDLLGGSSQMRRSATFTTGQQGGTTRAWLRVIVERRDTGRRAALRPVTGRLSDAPSQTTPIEEEAATTSEQNEVWTVIKRDEALERALLMQIREKLIPADERAERND